MPATQTFATLLTGALLTGALLPGCTLVGPNYQTPEARFAETWQDAASTEIASDPADNASWWKSFNDPVLDTLIAEAYANNLSLQIAGLRVYEARAVLGRVVGNLYPQSQQAGARASTISASENAAPVSSLPGPVADATDTSFEDYRLGAAATWELDFWGRFRRGTEAADANLAASIAAYDDFLVLLTGDVASAYVFLRTLQERLAFTESNVAIQRRSLGLAEQRMKSGRTTDLDVQRARALLAATRANTPSLEAGIRQTKNALSIMLARPPGELNAILGGAGVIPAGSGELNVGVPADLLRRRPDVREAALRAGAQSALIGVASADLYPAFRLGGSIGYAADSTGDLFEGDSATGVGTFGVMWKFLNYGRLKNNVRIQDARFQQSIAAYQLEVLGAAQEVEDALVGYLKAREEVSIREGGVDASQRAVDQALVQYRDGATNYTTVIDTQRFLVRDQDHLTVARGEVARNLIAAYKALGGGWELRTGNDFIDDDMKSQMRDRTHWGELLNADAVTPVAAEQRGSWRAPDR